MTLRGIALTFRASFPLAFFYVLGCAAADGAPSSSVDSGGSSTTTSGNAGSAGLTAGMGGAVAESAAGASGANVTGIGAQGSTGGTGGTVSSLPLCAEVPTLGAADGALQHVDLRLMYDGASFERGATLSSPEYSYELSQFLFFISQVKLRSNDGSWVDADITTAAGSPSPYGVHLFDLENTNSYGFYLRAPAAAYTALQLSVGLPSACNGGNPADRVAPLDASSIMNWAWAFGYIFFRLEGTSTPIAGGTPHQLQIHGGAIGGSEAVLTLEGNLNVGVAEGVPVTLELKPVLALADTQRDHVIGGRAMLDALPMMGYMSLAAP